MDWNDFSGLKVTPWIAISQIPSDGLKILRTKENENGH